MKLNANVSQSFERIYLKITFQGRMMFLSRPSLVCDYFHSFYNLIFTYLLILGDSLLYS